MQAFEAKLPPLVTGSDGVVRVSGTRVSLETVVIAFDEGATAEQIVQRYPSLELGAVYGVISYVLDHRKEIDVYMVKRRDYAQTIREQVENASSPAGIRARLLARRSSNP